MSGMEKTQDFVMWLVNLNRQKKVGEIKLNRPFLLYFIIELTFEPT